MTQTALRWLVLLGWAASCWGAPAAQAAEAAQDTRFDSGPELGQQLLRNVVRIQSLDFGEHDFGLVVGTQAGQLLIATARHVVVPIAGAESAGFDAGQRRIELHFCGGDASTAPAHSAALLPGFNADGLDLALLRVVRPAGYEPLQRVLAPASSLALRQPTWLLGQEQHCGVAPRSGAVAALANAQDQLRVEFPGVRGGASGGPALSGYGVFGLLTDADDLTVTVLAINRIEALVRAFAAGAWALTDAGNIPPDDPRAAEVDLAETLNQYLFSARNLQELLLQPNIPQPRFVAFADAYNAVVMNRFAPARERHDGSLRRFWPEPVYAQWQTLRERLWSVHQVFRALNAGDAQAIFDRRRAPPAVLDRMRQLDPELSQLQAGIADFLHALSQRSQP